MPDLQHTMGTVIRQERHDRRLTLKELARRSCLSVVYVGELERGKKYPSAVVLERLAEALDLTVPDLLELVADAMRQERLPAATSAIGFIMPNRPGTAPRVTVKRIVNLLEPATPSSAAFSSDPLELGLLVLPHRIGNRSA
jgi:transcriptional regulator with XRE-family HTH domain